jgi:hypothetical protein
MATAATTPVVSLNHVEPGVTFAQEPKEEFLPPRTHLEHAEDSRPALDVKVILYTDFSSARPESVMLGSLSDHRLCVRKPIPLDVSAEDGHIIVSWGDADEFACGASTGEALEEFSKTIAELFFDLNDQSIPLGNDLARVRDILNEHIEQVIIR